MDKTRTYGPGEVIGYLSNGKPIRVVAGGSTDVPPVGTPGAPNLQPNPLVAGEPVPPVAPSAPGSAQYFTTEDVERFRAQERAKLYDKITRQEQLLEELKGKVSTFDAEREQSRQAEQARQKAEEDATRKAAEEEMSARQLLEKQREETEARFAALQAEREQERAALEKERQFATLQAYIQRRVREEQMGETIAPELLDLVDGSNEEEIEQRILVLREKTTSMVTKMQEAFGQAAPPAAPRGVSPAGYAAVGPMENQTMQRQITPEELRDMPMSEYAKLRPQLIGQAAHSDRGNGLFG